MRDGANVQVLLERWWGGGKVADCFPTGRLAALAEVVRLRALWADRFPSYEVAQRFVEWMEMKIREEYAPGVRFSRNRRLRRAGGRRRSNRRKREGGGMTDDSTPIPDVDAAKAEAEMFAEVLEEAFLGVFARRAPESWYEKAAARLSRGMSRKLLDCFNAAHAAGWRQESRVAGLGEAIQLLCEPDRKPAGPYDFPTELAVLVVTRGVADAVLKRVRVGAYNSPDEVVGTALYAIEWAENDKVGKSQLLKFALAAGLADADAGRLIPAEVVFARMRDRASGD
jgi:antitoxin ParD1/3/4